MTKNLDFETRAGKANLCYETFLCGTRAKLEIHIEQIIIFRLGQKCSGFLDFLGTVE